MSKPFFRVKYIPTRSALPESLVKGRAYFLGDEQIIIINHGTEVIEYGGRPGPQGIAGEPLPQLQDQIDNLAAASLTTQNTIYDETLRRRRDINDVKLQHSKDFEQVTDLITDRADFLQSQADENASSILNVSELLWEKCREYDNMFAILTKTVANLTPITEKPEADPLDGEVITTDYGTYVIEQTTLDDGTLVLQLTKQPIVADTLQAGDKVDFDGSTWKVSNVSSDKDGTVSITIKP